MWLIAFINGWQIIHSWLTEQPGCEYISESLCHRPLGLPSGKKAAGHLDWNLESMMWQSFARASVCSCYVVWVLSFSTADPWLVGARGHRNWRQLAKVSRLHKTYPILVAETHHFVLHWGFQVIFLDHTLILAHTTQACNKYWYTIRSVSFF